ncbi:MAG: radical SAM protein [Candidatus Abyssubacteria bacterium]
MKTGTAWRSSNVFRQLLYAKTHKKRIPVKVAFQLTKHCNMRCNYCYTDFAAYKKLGERSTRETFEVIDELYAMGTRWLWFLGGEPMMRDDFGEIIEYSQRKGIFCDMNSNGTLINEKNVDFVKKLDAVCISIDGDEASNDYYRGKGSYKKAMAAVKLLRSHDVPVRLHAILTRKTAESLQNMAVTAKELGVGFNYCEVLLSSPDAEDHVLSQDETRAFYERYRALKTKGYPVLHSERAIDYIMKWPKQDGRVMYKEEVSKYNRDLFVPCLAGDLHCFFDLDGSFYACNGTWNDGLNANEVGMKKAWDYLAGKKCISCKCIGIVQTNLLFGLRPADIAHGVRHLVKL